MVWPNWRRLTRDFTQGEPIPCTRVRGSVQGRWVHNMCRPCWDQKMTGEPAAWEDAETDLCCYCGMENTDGVYVRQNPQQAPCEGKFLMHEHE